MSANRKANQAQSAVFERHVELSQSPNTTYQLID